jgi:hypothetical protein
MSFLLVSSIVLVAFGGQFAELIKIMLETWSSLAQCLVDVRISPGGPSPPPQPHPQATMSVFILLVYLLSLMWGKVICLFPHKSHWVMVEPPCIWSHHALVQDMGSHSLHIVHRNCEKIRFVARGYRDTLREVEISRAQQGKNTRSRPNRTVVNPFIRSLSIY